LSQLGNYRKIKLCWCYSRRFWGGPDQTLTLVLTVCRYKKKGAVARLEGHHALGFYHRRGVDAVAAAKAQGKLALAAPIKMNLP
jgi:hypothetical protein